MVATKIPVSKMTVNMMYKKEHRPGRHKNMGSNLDVATSTS